MTISINQLTSGIALRLGNDLFLVEEYHHVKPGKGSAFVRVKLRNLQGGQVLERTFRSADKLDDVLLEEKKLQMLYRSGDTYHFMDLTTYEETALTEAVLGEAVKFLKENIEVTGTYYQNQALKIDLPTFVEVEVTHTEPWVKGDSSRSGMKPAMVDTGASIQVPLFINLGDWIKIDTRTGVYVERLQR